MTENKVIAMLLSIMTIVMISVIWYLVHLDNKADERCAAVGASAKNVGHGVYLCITKDGRVVSTA